MKKFIIFAFLITFFSFISNLNAVTNIQKPREDFLPGEVLIIFKPNLSIFTINKIISEIGGSVRNKINLPKGKIYRISLQEKTQSIVQNTMEKMKSNPNYTDKIIAVEPNMKRYVQIESKITPFSQSNDPFLSLQWGYFNVDGNFSMTPTSSMLTVAVIDTGIDYTHPDLKDKVIKGPDYINADTDPMDDLGHGTHVAGIIGAKTNNGMGIAGIAWNSKVMAIKAIGADGTGSDFDVIQGILYAANNPSVKIVNMSLGGNYSEAEEIAVDYLVNTKGKLLIASAGNNNTNVPLYPAGFSTTFPNKVIAVAAHKDDNCKASFSNYGSWISISAPGVNILSTFPMNMMDYVYLSGTSMAAPFVSAAAALLWSQNPTLTNEQIGQLLVTRTSPTPLNRDGVCWPNDGSTFGRLNLANLLENTTIVSEDFGILYGIVMDAETGLPLSGATVTTKKPDNTITGKDVVPVYGATIHPYTQDIFYEYYGLFSIVARDAGTTQNLTITKTKYGTFSNNYNIITDFIYAGFIPIPPSKPFYWLTITWNPTYTGPASYDSYLFADYTDDTKDTLIYYDNLGSFYSEPYARFLWDSDSPASFLQINSETIRISRIARGATYYYYIYDWGVGLGSNEWTASGIKAYIWKWSGTKPVLINVLTPPAGQVGRFWDVGYISNGVFTVTNTISD
ncbi:MAG: S8 family serine peptidase [Proteobacteria bacterium]|nr:S8 family serine peptidase [Pseudomonadota bacterium]